METETVQIQSSEKTFIDVYWLLHLWLDVGEILANLYWVNR